MTRRTMVSRSTAITPLLRSVFSAQGILALYLWAGLFKPILGDYLSLDFTALLGGLLILSISHEAVFRRQRLRLPVPFCLTYGFYVCILLSSLMYTTAPIQAARLKLLRLVVVDGLAVVATLLLITDTERLEAYARALIVIGLALSIWAMAISVPGQLRHMGLGGGFYIGDSRAIGMALGFSIGMLGFRGLLEQAIVVTLALGLLLLPSRGPLISALISLLVFMLYRVKKLKKPSITALIGLLIAVYVLFWLNSQGYFVTIRLRWKSLSTGMGDASFSSRMDYARSAAEMFLKRPVFGWGLSSFPFYAGSTSFEESPHNLILELLCEVGVVGLLPFAALLVITARRLHVIGERVSAAVAQGLWCAFGFWILTIPALALSSARPFFSLMAAASAQGTPRLSSGIQPDCRDQNGHSSGAST